MRSDGLLNGDERSQERELLDYLLEQEGIEFFGEKKIARRSPDRPIPLSFAQERLWFLDQLQPASSTYNLPIVMRASGTLDVDLLRRSLSEIVRRHEVLRTRFIMAEGGPFQVVDLAAELVLPVVDLSAMQVDAREQRARQISEEEAQRPFDLGRGPLFRVLLIKLEADENLLILNQHHIVSDGWSLGVMWRELSELYKAYRNGQKSPFEELPVQYADYAVWQREWLNGEVLEKELGFWKRQLQSTPEVLELPTDRPRPQLQSSRGAICVFSLSAALTEDLKSLARREDATLFMVLLAGFEALLARYSGQQNFALGTPNANRERQEIEGLIGFFVNMLVLRADVAGNPTFRELLARVRERALEAYPHHDLPFEKLIEELGLDRNLGRSPLFQVAFALQNIGRFEMQFAGIRFQSIPVSIGASKYDLTLFMAENLGQLAAMIEYSSDLFDPETMARLGRHFESLLASAVASPNQAIRQLRLISEAERRVLERGWSGDSAELLPNTTLCMLVASHAAQSPMDLALIAVGAKITYGELNRRANQMARYLRLLDVSLETRVGVCLEHAPDLLIAMLGVLKAGGVFVSLETDEPGRRMLQILDGAAVKIVVTQAKLAERFRQASVRVVCLDRETDRARLECESGEELNDGPGPENWACVLYRSCWTGRPEGILIQHRTLVLDDKCPNLSLGATDRIAHPISFAEEASCLEVFRALAAAACIVEFPERSFSPRKLADIVRNNAVTVLRASAVTLERFAREFGYALNEVRLILCEEQAIRLWRLRETFKDSVKLQGRIYGMKGGAEAGGCWTLLPLVEMGDQAGIVLATQLAPGCTVYLLDEYLEPVPEGVVGEICLEGIEIALAYQGSPGITAQTFVPDPVSGIHGGRLYRSGELARWRANGELEFLGYKTGRMLVNAVRVEPEEIERILTEYPGVREAAVVLLERSDLRQPELVAFLAVDGDWPAAEALNKRFLEERLPKPMRPQRYMPIDRIPRTTEGQVDRRALLSSAEIAQIDAAVPFEAPQNLTEEKIASIWAQTLRVEKIGVHDNFFRLGGHSLLATQVIVQLRTAFGVDVPVRTLFEAPTVKELARRVDEEVKKGTSAIVPLIEPRARKGPIPLSFAQERLWFLDQLQPNTAAYNIPIGLAVTGQLDLISLRRSLSEIVRRHEILRTRFIVAEGGPVQVVNPAAELALPIVDLSAVQTEEREKRARQLSEEEAQRPFDLGRGPLVRALLIKLHAEEHLLILNQHHIVSDLWSLGILCRELGELYKAYTRGNESPLSELTVQYADYALWQREWLSGEVLERELDFWKKQLERIPAALELPTDRPRPQLQSSRGSILSFQFPVELTRSLKGLSGRSNATLFMVLLAGFEALVARYSGQTHFALGTSIANRNHGNAERLLGFFVNTLVLCSDLSGNPDFQELLNRVRDRTLEAYAHQDFPFGKLVDELNLERDLSRQPLVQVMFVMQNVNQPVLELGELRLRDVPLTTETSKYDLSLFFVEGASGLLAVVEYNTDLFDTATIASMIQRYQVMLEGAVASPQSRIWSLPILKEDEKHRVLTEWKGPQVPFPPQLSIGEVICTRVSHAPALISNGEELDYGELVRRVNCMAVRLRARGVGVEDRVAIRLERAAEWLVAALAVLNVGGVFIPLDSSEPARRIAFILQNSGAGWVITEERLGQLFEQSPVQLLYLQKEDAKLNEKNEAEPAARNSSQAPACILYRSGSTGRPEAIVLPLGALRAKGIISESDRVALRLNFSHELIPLEMFSAVAAGACVVELSDLPPRMLADLLRDQAVTVLFVSASILERLSSEFPRSLSKVRLILCGEGIDFLRKLRSSLPADLVGRVFGLYGATEAGGACMMYPVSALDSNAHVMPIGQLAISTSLCVMDEMLNRVPEGMVGEICIGGEGLALGFDRDTVPTTSGRVADSLSPIRGTQLLRTGQLASLRPSGLELRGRRDGLTVIDGMRAGLEEIEAVLLECPDLSSTAVVAHEVSGLGESGLAAFVVAKEGRALSVEDLKDFLKAQLPDYMIPREIVFLTSLPRTPQGEVDRHAVSRLYKEGKGIGSVPQTYVAPRGLVEDSLAKIWAEIFGIVRVGIHDNFFALGGDSILSILAVTRASRVGIQITARQMFERQTIAGLASVAGRVELVAAEQGSVSGPVPLTPAQRWFFEEDFRDKHHFNQAVMLATRERVDASLLKQLVAGLLQQHDALRMRFSQDNGEWRQEIAPQEDVDRVFARVELNAADGALQILMQQASEWQGSLNLQHGPLIRVVLFELGERREQRVLILVHHLLVDGVSWRILLEDLERGCRQLQRGGSVDLPTKTSSFQQWARQLQVYSQAEELKQEAVYWRGISARPIKPLPRDRHIRENTVSSAETVTISIGKEQTRALLQEVPRAYRMRIHEVLLTAFALAVREWTAVDNLRIDLEGHGREEIGGTVDVTRTVGWFTAIFPVYLELQGVSDPGAALKRVKEQMRAVPRRGIGYGILRFLTIEQALDESRSEMIFNYLGQFDRVLDTEGVFQGANESPGVLQSPRAERSYLLEVNAAVQEGQLQVQCVYNVNAHQPKTIENLLNEFSQKLQLLIAHCQTTAVGSHTPSDFPSVNVSQEFLDSLSELGGEIENIYPLVSMQEDMLLQTVKAPHTGVYFEQLSFAVEGLRPEMFERAWQRVMDRHAALRSRFAWMSLDHPVQIVQRRAEINLERQDWNSLQDADPTALLDEFLLRDRARGFDLTQAPLMRLTLIRSRRNDWIVWSFHHIILDGWSGAILMQEVFSSYRALCDGSEPDLGRAADYEAYIGWRQRQSQDKPEQFWRAQLKGFHGPSALRVQDLNEMHPSVDIGRETVQFSDDEVRVLESFARQRQLTLNTVVQGMWSILLSAYTGNPEVMFGAWGSGRSADVLDIEKIVGALINTLPVRVRVDSEAELVAWLKTIQEQQLEQRQHEHINLLKLLAWSEVPGEPLLFNTVLVFENYPVSASLGGQITESGLRIFDVLAREQTHYPIAIRVMPRNNLALLIEYDRCLYTKEMAWRILLDLQRLLQAVAGNPKHRIKNLLPLLRAGLTS